MRKKEKDNHKWKNINIFFASEKVIGDEVAAEQPEMDIAFTRFQNEELPEKGQVQVKYTSIDFFRHTNNIEYIRFIWNTYFVREP